MKKLISIVMIMTLILAITGCSPKTPEVTTGQAQSTELEKIVFPEENLKILVPFAPGGAVDVTCRFLAEVAPDYLGGKKIIIENMEGGGGVVGQNAGAKANPDGYTILAYTSSVVTNPMTKETDYTYESFQTIAMYCYDPEVLVVSVDSEFESLSDFISKAKASPVSLCTPGNGTSHHIAGMILQDRTGIEFRFIHNDGAAMQVTQLLGGHVDAGLMAYGEAKSQILDGKLKVLGIMSDQRNEEIPDVPTFVEEGIALDYGAFRGLAVPADTPKEVVEALDKAFEGMINDSRYVEKMATAGYPLVYRGAADFTEYVNQNASDMEKIIPLLNQ